MVALTDFGGAIVARYTYDAWGKLLTVTDANGNDISSNASHIANLNPIRYRSYVYDTESGFYYLTSRYYDPTVGRFISADAYTSTGQGYLGHNMFAYCNNNPVTGYDPTGSVVTELAIAIVIVSAVVGAWIGAESAEQTGGNVIEGAIEGCYTGALGAIVGLSFSNPVVAALVGIGCGFFTDAMMQHSTYFENPNMDNFNYDWGRSAKVALQTGGAAAVPPYGSGVGNVADAVGTIIKWTAVSMAIAAADVVVANAITQEKTASQHIPSGGGSSIPTLKFSMMVM